MSNELQANQPDLEGLAIPVAEAKRLSGLYQKDVVVIVAYDDAYEMLHTATYGISAKDKSEAANWGELFVAVTGSDLARKVDFEDYRLTRIKELEDALRLAINTIECASIDIRTGEPLPWYKHAQEVLARPLSVADREPRT